MKMNNKLAVKLTVIALLLVLIGTFTHCVPQVAKEIGDGGGSEKSVIQTPSNNEPDEGQIINQLQVTTGVKNFEQILHTMGAVTGIDPYSNTAIMGVYRQVESSLPSDNDIKVYTATQQVAVTKLAAEFCFQLTQGAFAAQRAVVWPGLNLGAQVQNAFNEANSQIFIDDTIDAFWGGVLSETEYNMAVTELKELILDLKGADTTSTTATGRVVRGVCTAALSSAYVTLL